MSDYMYCRRCHREVWGDVATHRKTCDGLNDQGRPLLNILDDINPDTVAADLLQYIDFDREDEYLARRENFE